ncbi:MAG: DUF6607 family protein [Opitutaceae bacterium]
MNARFSLPGVSSLAIVLLVAGCQTPSTQVPALAQRPASATTTPASKPETPFYVFGWGDLPESVAKPRGGSSRGAPVMLAPGRVLPLPEIVAAPDAFMRDRAAILSLAGDYRVSFHFMETLGLAADYAPRRSYYSWATEHIRVIEDTGRFISLQHTLVMFFKKDDGTTSEPALVKHWRQDWTYEPAELHTFRGDNTWARRRPPAAEVAGAWSQAVFQVDDSPRYAALGRWEHRGNLTVWNGEREWRPLPRRERTVRKDYGVMEGSHRIVLTPTGWLHEQQNWKRVTGESTAVAASPRYIGEEWGLDRYERITAPNLAAADTCWRKTGPYWAAVRRAWAEVFAQHDRFALRAEAGGKKRFEEHFAYAEKLESGQPFDAADAGRHAREIIGL